MGDCTKCIYRSPLKRTANRIGCKRWPGPAVIIEDKFGTCCGEFVEGDPAFMTDLEEKKWVEQTGKRPSIDSQVAEQLLSNIPVTPAKAPAGSGTKKTSVKGD